MSGRAKKSVYYTLTGIFLLAALAACVLMVYAAYRESGKVLDTLLCALTACGVYILFAPCVLVHECGHLFFGLCARLKPVSVRVGRLSIEGKKVRLSFSSAAGATRLIPIGTKNVRRRMIAASLGGALFNFAFGVVFSVLFFTLPYHPALLFFELFAPLHLFEGFCALLPAELGAGRTDGELIRQLKNRAPEAQVFIDVLTVQGILHSKTFDEVDSSLLFDTLVVREDDPAFLSLLHLRWQYLMWKGETARASEALSRLEELSCYLDEREAAQIECDAKFMRRIAGEKTDMDYIPPVAAKGSCAYLRAELAAGRGDKEAYKKTAAAETAAGIRALESTFFERFIQNF